MNTFAMLRFSIIVITIVFTTYTLYEKHVKIREEIKELTNTITKMNMALKDDTNYNDDNDDKKSTLNSSPIGYFHQINIDTLIKIGQIFAYKQISKALLSDHLPENLPWENDLEDRNLAQNQKYHFLMAT